MREITKINVRVCVTFFLKQNGQYQRLPVTWLMRKPKKTGSRKNEMQNGDTEVGSEIQKLKYKVLVSI